MEEKSIEEKSTKSEMAQRDDLWIGKAPCHRLVKDTRVYQ